MIKDLSNKQRLEATEGREGTIIGIAGLQREVRLLHITDSHVAEADERDEQRIVLDAERCRQIYGGHASEYFEEAIRNSSELQVDCTIFTGDIVQFPSIRNVEYIEEQFGLLSAPYLYTLGNHDWLFTHHTPQDELRAAVQPQFARAAGGDAALGMTEIAGVKLITLDNSNYQIDEAQLQFVKEQLAANQPTLLFFHIPLCLPDLLGKTLDVWQDPILIDAPDWDAEARLRWGLRPADESTREFHRMITAGDYPNLAAIFCGHLHFPHREAFGDQRYQYVTKAGFDRGYRTITLKPLPEAGAADF